MSARSSESSLTMVFTVEYKMGLAHPETPKRYQAKNLQLLEYISIGEQGNTNLRAVGMFQMIMHNVENKQQIEMIV